MSHGGQADGRTGGPAARAVGRPVWNARPMMPRRTGGPVHPDAATPTPFEPFNRLTRPRTAAALGPGRNRDVRCRRTGRKRQ